MSAPTRLTGLTWDEFFELPEELLKDAELLDGEVVVNPPVPDHQLAVVNIVVALRLWTRSRPGRGEVTLEPLVRISERRGYQPDIAWFPADRCRLAGEIYYSRPPALVIEVLSPTTRRLDLLRKPPDYLGVGIDEVWVVDGDAVAALVYRGSPDHPVAVPLGDHLTSPLLPGFSLPVADIFDP